MVQKIGHAIVWVLTRGGFLVTAAGPLLFALQCLTYLKLGTWQSINVKDVWDAMGFVAAHRLDWRTEDHRLVVDHRVETAACLRPTHSRIFYHLDRYSRI